MSSLRLLFCVFFLFVGTISASAESSALRVRRDKANTVTHFDVEVRQLRGPGGRTVDLVGAVHYADKAHYRELNRRFKGYDAVLYELVAPKGTRVPKGGGNGEGAFAMIGKIMKAILALDSQLERVDYQRKNFVHADLSFAGLANSAKSKGDDIKTIALEIAIQLIRQSNLAEGKKPDKEEPEQDFMEILSATDGSLRIKRLLAEALATDEASLALLSPTVNRLLIKDRNQECIRVLKEQLQGSKRRFAIYYGAGHLPDLETRLVGLGFRRTGQEWLTAWDLSRNKGGVPPMFHLLTLVAEMTK